MNNIGIDIVDVERIKNALQRRKSFLTSIFTDEEIGCFRAKNMRPDSIAGNFAVKEAFSKFLGTGVRGFSLKDIELLHESNGKPYILFKGVKTNTSVSISHTDSLAVAVVTGDLSNSTHNLITDYEYLEDIRRYVPQRRASANKGDCGRVFIVAGSKGLTGAAALSAYSSLRTGSGLVTVGVPMSEQTVLACKLTEAMTYPLPCEDGGIKYSAVNQILEKISRSNVCVFGMGLGKGEDIYKILEDVLLNTTNPILIDADGINALSKNINILDQSECEIVLTPHPAEMSRITGLSVKEIQSDRASIAKEFAARHKVTVVLKGQGTVIAYPDGGVFVNPTGNAGMATGGTGDVLSGVIGSLMGQGVKSSDAARLGTYIHGLAGDIAKMDRGEMGLIASDVAECIPYAIKTILNLG